MKVTKCVYCICICVFICCTYHIVSWWFIILLLGEIGRQLVEVPLTAAITPYLISPTHPPNPCMKCYMGPEIEIDHHTGNKLPLCVITIEQQQVKPENSIKID